MIPAATPERRLQLAVSQLQGTTMAIHGTKDLSELSRAGILEVLEEVISAYAEVQAK